MIHIRNSKPNSVFFLEHEGIPTALVTDFSEPIVNGSLCIDTTNEQLYQLRNSVWVLIGGGSSSNISSLVVATTYNALQTHASTGGLTAGIFYQISYQTKHLIPNTSELHTGNSETLLLQAINGSNFSQRVTSIQYPQDIIYYNFYDNKVENTLTARSGNIYYRKDPIKNLETHYDFRNVKYRRWKPDVNLHKWHGTSGAGANISHKFGEVIIDNDVVFVCSNEYTSSNPGFFNYNKNYTPVIRLSATSISHLNALWKPVIQLTENNTGSGGGDGKLYADTSGHTDYYTFNDFSIKDVMRNIKIGKNSYNRYNNIVFITSAGTWASNYLSTPICRDIEIKENCSDMMLDGRLLYDVIMDYNCSDIYMSRDVNDVHLKSYTKNLTAYNGMTNANIGFDSQYIHINNVYGINIGNLTTNVFLSEFFNENINIGGNNNKVFIEGSQNTDIFIGDGFTDNYIGDNITSTIYTYNFDNKLNDIFYNNHIGLTLDWNNGSNGSENIRILGGMNKNIVIGKNCNDISIGAINSGGSQNIHIGDTTTTVHLKNGGNINVYIGKSCENIIASNIYSSGIFNVTIKNNTNTVELNDTLNVFIDSDCQNIKIKDANEITVGKGCLNILSEQGSANDKNIFGDYCKDITFVSGSNRKNHFLPFSENIYISGSSGVSESIIEGCSHITFSQASVYNCKFGKNFNYATFHSGSLSFVEFTTWNTNSTPANFFGSLSCSMVDAKSGSGYYFARTINDSGATIYNQYL
jgi:hypothetical protein